MKSIFLLIIFSFPLFASMQMSDPHAWLEEMNSEKTTAWVENQNQMTQAYLLQIPSREKIKKKLQAISDYESYGLPCQKGNRLFFFKTNKGDELHHLAMRASDNETRTLVTSDPKAPLANFEVNEDGTLMAYSFSDAGSDHETWKFFHIETEQLLPDTIEDIQFSSPIWDLNNQGVYYIHYKDAALYYHKLGEKKDRLLLQMESKEEKLLITGLVHVFKDLLLFQAYKEKHQDHAIYIFNLKNKECRQLIPYDQGKYYYIGKVNEKLLFWTDFEANHHRIVAYDGTWSEFIPESDDILMEATVVDEKITCHYLQDCISVIKRFDSSGKFLNRISLPGKGTACLAHESPFFSYTDTTTPCAIYSYDKGVYFKPSIDSLTGYVTKQLFFPSKDGTRIPLFITHRKGFKLTGNHPTLLYGYGGFDVPLTPVYRTLIAAWLDIGGVFALANLRGGGEYGKAWYESGSLQNKQNTFDDFIAAAEFLITSGYTCSSKLAINGHSNGGLLVGACLTQRPDLFAAAVPQVGVFDMLKFHQFTIGWAWKKDYGDPENPNDISFLRAYSPYHNIKEGTNYPSTLITTADHDDRVVPLHSYKFAAQLQEAQAGSSPILLRVYVDTGHGRGRSLEQVIEERTDILSFLMHELDNPR